MNRYKVLMRLALVVVALGLLPWAGDVGVAQSKQQTRAKTTGADKQTTIVDAAGRKHTRMPKVTQAERTAAADRLRALAPAGATREAAAGAAIEATAAASVDPSFQLKVGPNGQLIPDYSGRFTPNYANSPMPVLTEVGGATLAVGHELMPRPYATGSVDLLAVLPAPLPAGTLTEFLALNQVGGINGQSAGKTFIAYVLRLVGGNDYQVVYSSGPQVVGPVAADTSVAYRAGVEVQAGDLLAFWGQGIPMDTAAGPDTVYYQTVTPAPGAAGSLITLGVPPYPLHTTRTFSFGATVTTPGSTRLTGGIRKFVNELPGLTAAGRNNIGQYIPVAVPDTTTYPGSDYYELELGEYSEQMHSDLPPTRLRGYRQTNSTDATVSVFRYLGPLIIASKGHPVRIKFTNKLPADIAGNLFIPVDTTVMGAGQGPSGDWTLPADVACAGAMKPTGCYTENRATIHLHGGVTPWISDGTTYQWIVPADETNPDPHYRRGASVAFVPDMWFDTSGATIGACAGQATCAVPDATNDPGQGSQTFYYTNDQSARLMFYHDHAHGVTRLNVYVGEAAGYLLTDVTEQALINEGAIPADQIPLVIQDKTFVDATTIHQQDPTWNWGTGATFEDYVSFDGSIFPRRTPVTGDLWWPHVYMPAQNPYDLSGANPMGRWHYGPYFWPPTLDIPYLPVANPYHDCDQAAGQPCTRPWQPPAVPGTPNPSWGAEAFMDTPVINGTAYPTITVQPKAYRFRILNAAHDRFWNLQLYKADPDVTTPDGRTMTEVRMLPAVPNAPYLANNPAWPADGREGGVPDPSMMGPDWIQIGTEGGFLPRPVIVPNQPIAWNLDPTTFNFGNVSDKSLLIAPAERADVIVDFSAYAGQTLILYNDAPAAFPALDARNDYYTGAPDLTETGGVAGTLPGYGPNIRTLMQIKVEGQAGAPFDVAALRARFEPDPANSRPGVFETSQDPIIVGQSAYDGVYTHNTTFPSTYPYWGVARIQDTTSLKFETTEGDGALTEVAIEQKAIQDEMGETFDDYGRMSAKLGLTTPDVGRGFVLQGYADPPTELVKLSDNAVLIGQGDDGTQIWKITHNGVDTHPIHFHLFHVQLLNRVGWDGAIRLPDENELGWKDTVRISPLEDTIVAVRPIAPTTSDLPAHWGELPNSWRLLNPAMPEHSSLGFANVDPAGNAVTVTNELTNFGWEYVWHCHILSHEENDMMRAVAFAFPPAAPSNLVATAGSGRVDLAWDNNASILAMSGFTLMRSTVADFTANVVVTPLAVTTVCPAPSAPACSYTDTTVIGNQTYYYRLAAANTIGSSIAGYPRMTANSVFLVGEAVTPTGGLTATPVSIDFGTQLVNTNSLTRTVTVRNQGNAAASMSIAFTGANTADFARTAGTCGANLNIGATCTVVVRFRPIAAGPRTATLSITPTLGVPLSGVGLAPVASVSPATLAFSSPLSITSPAQAVTVTNTGTAALTITGIARNGANPNQFAHTHNCPGTLAIGASCTVNVTFTPTSASPLTKTANLRVNVAAPGVSQVVPLTGTVIVPTFTLAPSNLAFGNQVRNTTSPAQVITVTNTGTAAPLRITGVTRSGANANQFLHTTTCGPFPALLAPGATCTVTVTFRPTTVGAKVAQVNVVVSAPGTTQSVPLTGAGI